MKVVGIGRLQAFQQAYEDARPQLDALISEIMAADWRSRRDVVARFGGAHCFASNRVVFNIVSGRIQVDVKINYASKIVLIVRLGTSAESESWRF